MHDSSAVRVFITSILASAGAGAPDKVRQLYSQNCQNYMPCISIIMIMIMIMIKYG